MAGGGGVWWVVERHRQRPKGAGAARPLPLPAVRTMIREAATPQQLRSRTAAPAGSLWWTAALSQLVEIPLLSSILPTRVRVPCDRRDPARMRAASLDRQALAAAQPRVPHLGQGRVGRAGQSSHLIRLAGWTWCSHAGWLFGGQQTREAPAERSVVALTPAPGPSTHPQRALSAAKGHQALPAGRRPHAVDSLVVVEGLGGGGGLNIPEPHAVVP